MNLLESSLIKKSENDIGDSIVEVGGDVTYGSHWLPELDGVIKEQLSKKGSGGGVDNLEEITWSGLKIKRDGDSLAPGTWYRITDYQCTTGQENTRSAGNQFDVVVLALSTNTLSEEARAMKHDSDTYFTSGGAKLEAWKIWYCLDNDTSRFAWAHPYLLSPITHQKIMRVGDGDDTYIYVRYPGKDDENGVAWVYATEGDGISILRYVENGVDIFNTEDIIYTQIENVSIGETLDMGGESVVVMDTSMEGTGVIYRMIDEWNNDCPYDFKNIQFVRNLSSGALSDDSDDATWVYTFNGYNDNDEECYDMSATPFRISTGTRWSARRDGDDTDEADMCFDNKIGILKEDELNYGYWNLRTKLNDIVFLGISYDNGYDEGFQLSHCYRNIFGDNCYDNTFGNSCNSNTFGNNCYNNTFGNNCHNNIFGNSCNSNTFGDSYFSNTFGNNCYNNTFGNNCHNNIFGNSCNSNTFGDSYFSNTFGNDCYNNTFGNECYYNTFESNCMSNTFGNECHYNTFGSKCIGNTFGDYCSSNTFGDGCIYIKFGNSSTTKNYYKNIIVDNGNQYIYLYCSNTTSNQYPYQNVRIALGVNNTTTWKTITDSNRAQTFETVYRPEGSKVISV